WIPRRSLAPSSAASASGNKEEEFLPLWRIAESPDFLAQWVEMKMVVLTGAGISAESGIPTFRGADGLWEGHRVEDVATPEGFARDPQLVHSFYNARRSSLLDPRIQPNPAHRALARLGRAP